MRGPRRRYYVVIGLLLVSAGLSSSLERSRPEGYAVRLSEFPMAFGSWRGRDVELKKADVVYAVLETSAVLSRIYEGALGQAETVDLLVTYFERGHRGFHPPEVSFMASGNTITESGIVRVPLAEGENAPFLEANMFLGRTPTQELLFVYWFGIGDRLIASYYKGSLYLLVDTILQRPHPASMVRVALPVVDGDREGTMATATRFIRDLVPRLPEYLVEVPQ